MQAVGDDTDVVVRQTGNTVGIVGGELADHTCLSGRIIIIIGFVVAEYTVALVPDGGLGLQDGKVKGCCQFSIAPRLALLDRKRVCGVVRHGPNDDGYGDNDQCRANQQITPQYVVFEGKIAHLLYFWGKDTK